jgi:hypothetical protein
MKVVGQLVELDPNKKYVMLIERNILTPDDMQLLALHMQKQEGSLLSITLPHFDCIRFVENSDRIVDVQEAKPQDVLPEGVAENKS